MKIGSISLAVAPVPRRRRPDRKRRGSTIDTARLSLLLDELRQHASSQPSPSMEVTGRARRRIERHLTEARLLPGKIFDNFDFEAGPMVSKEQLYALAAGDSWLGSLTLIAAAHAASSHSSN